jgi:hypothetical protein
MKAMIKNAETGSFEDRTIEVLHDAVIQCCGPNGWDLYANSDSISQQLKALSECGEACDSVNKGDYEQLKDDIGDIMVCLINWCQIDYHCFLSAWVAVFSANGTEAGYVEIENDDNKITVIELVNCISMAERAADCIDSAIIILKEICAVSGLDIVECLGVAYDVISKRKGRIINGTFVKNLVLQ